MRYLAVTALLVFSALLGIAREPRAAVDYWPLIEISDEGTTVLYPLYVHEGNFLMMFPFYYRTHEARDHHLVWPLVKVSEGRLRRVLPVWFRGEQDLSVFPLFRMTPTYTAWSVPPLFFSKLENGNRQSFVAPSIFRETDADGKLQRMMIWPIFGFGRKDDQQVLRLLSLGGTEWEDLLFGLGKLRLFQYSSRNDEGKADFAILGRMEWAPQRFKALVFPVFFRTVEGEHRSLTVFPIFRRWSNPDARRGIWLAPFLWDRGLMNPDDLGVSLLPLFNYDRTSGVQELWLAPYFRRWSVDNEKSVVFPLYWYEESPRVSRRSVVPLFGTLRETSLESGDKKQSFWLFAGAYHRSKRVSQDGVLMERRRRFLVFSDELIEGKHRTFRILGVPIVERIE